MKRFGIQIIVCVVFFGLLFTAERIDFLNISYYGEAVKAYLARDYQLEEIKDNALTAMSNLAEKPAELYAAITEGIETRDYIMPVDEITVSVFNSGEKNSQTELKYISDENIVVYSSQDGIVKTIEENAASGDKTIIIGHSKGIETHYSGCTQVFVKEEDKVERGQIIASAGGEGVRRLVFEVWENGEKKNPAEFINED